MIQKRRPRQRPQGVSILWKRTGETTDADDFDSASSDLDDPIEMFYYDILQDLLCADDSVFTQKWWNWRVVGAQRQESERMAYNIT